MLAFGRPVEKEGSAIGYRDHRSHDHVYLLPHDLEVVRDAQGRPAFSLFGFAGQHAQGWWLTLKLRSDLERVEWAPEDEEPNETVVVSHIPVDHAWIRLRFVIPTAEGQETYHSPWSETRVIGGQITGTGIRLGLDKDQGKLLESLLDAEALPVEALQVEVKMTYRGLRPTFPVAFSFIPFEFETSMRAGVASLSTEDEDGETDPYDRPIPKATVLEFQKSWLETLPPGAFSPTADAQGQAELDELSLRLVDAGWKPTGGDHLKLRRLTEWTDLLALDGDAAAMETVRLTWDLRVPVVGEGQWEGIWKFSEFWNALNAQEREELFARVPVPAPLKPMPIHMTSTIPLDPHQIRKIIIKLHYYGKSLSWEDHEVVFDQPGEIASTIWAVVPHGEPFYYYHRLEAFFGIPEQGGWPPPPIRLALQRTDDPYIGLTPPTFNVSFLHLEAQVDTFDGIGRIEVQLIGAAPDEAELEEPAQPVQKSVWLTRTRPDRFVMIDQDEETTFQFYRIVVHPPEGVDADPVVTLDKTPIPQQRILVTAFYTQVVHPEMVRLTLMSGPDFPAVYILVRLKTASEAPEAEGELFVLDEQGPEAFWAVWLPDVFATLVYQWRAEIHFKEGSGLAPLFGQWAEAQTRELVFDALPGGA